MKNKKKLYSISLASIVIILMLVGIAGAAPFAYITNMDDDSVSVIDISDNHIVNTLDVGVTPIGVAVNPAGTRAYVANSNSNTVSVIDTTTNTVIEAATVYGLNSPRGIAVNPEGT
ncbi:MAG: YncE family protein, partial [Alphaproteobacteria bacterium]